MGEAPRWYATMQAARYLKVPPWVLADMPYIYQAQAQAAIAAEAHAREVAEKDARRNSRR